MLFDVPDLDDTDAAVLEALDGVRVTLRHAIARPRRWSGVLRRQIKARAVRGSNSIEGIEISGDDAFAIVGGEEDQVSVDQTWLAAKGYSDAMTYTQILARRDPTAFDESTLLALHFMVQGYDLSRNPGSYRHGEIFVRDDDAQQTVYRGPDADEVPPLMTEYVQEIERLARRDVPPMVQAAMAHLNLVMIHPFSDGNGRLSRIMQSMILYREHVAEAEFVSIEEYLGRNTQAYYDVLARVGGGAWNPDGDAREWLEFVLTAHFRQARTVQRRIWVLDRIAERVDAFVDEEKAPARAVPALEHVLSGWRLRNTTYRELAEVSANVASRDLNALVEVGILQRHGAKRGTWYSPDESLREWLQGVGDEARALIDVGEDPYRSVRRGEQITVEPPRRS